MDLKQLKSELSNRLTAGRFNHVLRVTEIAIDLAKRYNESVAKAELAALFHDIAKCKDVESLRLLIIAEEFDDRLLSFHHELWHAPAGATIAFREFNVTDDEVLNAIRFHTTGREGMSRLEKIIYVADMIEPRREFPGVEQLRVLAKEDIDMAMGACIRQSVQFLLEKQFPVFPDSIDCYNEHVMTKGIVEK